MADQEYPDIFGDGVSVSVGPYGVSLTFYLQDPLTPVPASRLPGPIVARIRVTPDLAEALSDNIKQGLAGLPNRTVPEGEK